MPGIFRPGELGQLRHKVLLEHPHAVHVPAERKTRVRGGAGRPTLYEHRAKTLLEMLDALRNGRRGAAGRTPLIVGVGALTTDLAEDLARDAREAGSDGLLLAPMSYQPLTDEEVFRHFEAVAAAGGLPLCIYNNPGTTKFTFSPDLIARLAEPPNVIAVKMPLAADGDYAGELQRLRAMTPADFAIGYSGDWGAKDALLAGGACWYSVVAGLLPEPALALTRAAQAGHTAREVAGIAALPSVNRHAILTPYRRPKMPPLERTVAGPMRRSSHTAQPYRPSVGVGHSRVLKRQLSLTVSTMSQFEPVRAALKRPGDVSRPNGSGGLGEPWSSSRLRTPMAIRRSRDWS
ncbi:Dihydrodipicolinate synthase [Salipiger mucosus DSM 16094]|uniref:Dihydrodipicolinate synthase n=1 Tax=Salipiger mucosus DSM 16094 TaxID=1123237 RepID=S9RC69_9RHOB|nr:Dihydrodipicolinate synthase [Salipiger mucosus DSM 16094]